MEPNVAAVLGCAKTANTTRLRKKHDVVNELIAVQKSVVLRNC